MLRSGIGGSLGRTAPCTRHARARRYRVVVRALVLTLAAVLRAGVAFAPPPLVPLAQPGPWSGISGLIGYGARLWFVNSVKFVDHNSADVYSYDPRTGDTRYERHLFSQDAGEPVVAGGLLYWPFEDARFSTGHGEYLVTNGAEWGWRVLPEGQVFHIHAMAASGGALFAATSAWRAGLQRSDDAGAHWRIEYDHPTPPGLVSRLTALAVLDGTLYAGLTAYAEPGAKLLEMSTGTFWPVRGWPPGVAADALVSYGGRLYAVNHTGNGSSVWRTDGTTVERIQGLDGQPVRALAAGPGDLWAVSGGRGGGALWRSHDGLSWTTEHSFRDAEPLDVAVYGGRVYVGTAGPGERGTLWGPPAPAPVEAPLEAHPLPPAPHRLAHAQLAAALTALDRTLREAAGYADHGAGLRVAVEPLALSGLPAAGPELARRLSGSFPDLRIRLFGGALTAPAAALARWYLLWALALAGAGRVPLELLSASWTAPPNSAEKYLEPAPAWAAAQVGQTDAATLFALVERLGGARQPSWLDGDLVGALTVLTGERFAYDRAAWRRWWAERQASGPATWPDQREVVPIPAGSLSMGSETSEPAEAPVHRVALSSFAVDRFEVTNAEFAALVAAAGYTTDPERSGAGWHWDGHWREVKGTDWRHPRGPGSSIEGLERHPVVQVSWNDARAFCHWRGARLPTEAEWERAARGDGGRTYPWGDAPPRDGSGYRASYGSDDCCRADAGDGYLYTAPVGSFPRGRSPFGVDDLAGNVWEWVEDWFDPTFYRRSPAVDPLNRNPSGVKVIRGGGWGNDAWGLRATLRHANPPDMGLSMVGFRCAR